MSFLREFNELYVNLTYRCNLDCPFCSTKAGGFFNKGQAMTVETALACVDILLCNAATPYPVLFFFGGEPMLQAPLIRQAVEYGRRHEARQGKRVRFVIVTNGVLVDDAMLDFAARHEVDFQIDLDGPQEIHDTLRRTASGQGTFERVMHSIRQAEAGQGFHLTLRSHIPPANPHFLRTMEMLEAGGLRRLSLAFNLIMGLSPDSEFLWRRADFERHEELFLEFVRRYGGHILQVQEPVVDFFGLLGYYRSQPGRPEHFCNAGRVRLSVSPSGEVYPCFTMEDQERFCIGHVDQGINRFQVTRFLTMTGRDALVAQDGSDPSEVFMYLCPFQTMTLSGRVNVVPKVLQEAYSAFSALVGKMKVVLGQWSPGPTEAQRGGFAG
jgi:uncharacterized protein